MSTMRTHFTFRVDTWTADGESIVEHVAGVEESALSVKFPLPQSPAYYLPLRCDRDDGCPLYPGDLNRSTQHLLILLDKEVADGDVTDIVHGEAEG